MANLTNDLNKDNGEKEGIVYVDFSLYPVADVIKILLKDRTTGKNIVYATDAYKHKIPGIEKTSEISSCALLVNGVQTISPRVRKTRTQQLVRTKLNAEVFTPAWICNAMNNRCDEDWFGRQNVFNTEVEQGWSVNQERIFFDKDKSWKDYVTSTRLEITCGEAPYLVSRYDASSGEIIPVRERIGVLDRKLRVVSENVNNVKTWNLWAKKAFQSVYGYEYQGDNLLIARANLLLTYTEHLYSRWGLKASQKELVSIATIISWNLWQMDGLKGGVPFKKAHQPIQLDLWGLENSPIQDVSEDSNSLMECRIYDWKHKKAIFFKK